MILTDLSCARRKLSWFVREERRETLEIVPGVKVIRVSRPTAGSGTITPLALYHHRDHARCSYAVHATVFKRASAALGRRGTCAYPFWFTVLSSSSRLAVAAAGTRAGQSQEV